jgi:hypothetical protein
MTNLEFGIRNALTHSKFRIPNSEFRASSVVLLPEQSRNPTWIRS